MRAGGKGRRRRSYEKELRAALVLQKLAAFARGVYSEDGQQGDK